MLWQVFTMVHFYMNREEIAAEHCINKDKPEVHCNGQCHLTKQLKAATPDKEETDDKPATTNRISFLLFVFANTTNQSNEFNTLSNGKHLFQNKEGPTSVYHSEILNPPQFT